MLKKKRTIYIIIITILALLLLLVTVGTLLINSYLSKVQYDTGDQATGIEDIQESVLTDEEIIQELLADEPNSDESDSAKEEIAALEEQMEAQSDAHNKAFTSGVLEDNIIAVLENYSFDGVHFDYEYPLSLKAWHYYNRFLVSMDKALGDDYTLGVAGNTWNLKFTAAAIKAIDTFEWMSYDYNDAEGKHSTYDDTIAQISKLGLHGIPPEKINIGLPFYSRPTDLSPYWYGYNGCYDGIDENGWYHCPDTGKDFWFNTPDVIEEKTEYAIHNGYGGVMVWHYNCDLPSSHEDSLFRAIDTAIKNNY